MEGEATAFIRRADNGKRLDKLLRCRSSPKERNCILSVRALCTQPPRDLTHPFLCGAVMPRCCLRTVWTPSSQPAQQTSNSCKPPSPEQNNSRADTHARAPLSPATAPCNLSSCVFVGSRTAAEVAVQSAGGQAMAEGKGKKGNSKEQTPVPVHNLTHPSKAVPQIRPSPNPMSPLHGLLSAHLPRSWTLQPAIQLPLGAGLTTGSSARFPSVQRDCLSLPIFSDV